MKRKLFLAVALLGLVQLAPHTWAKDEKPAGEEAPAGLKPVAVLSIAGYDKVMGDVAYLGKLADDPDMAAGLETTLGMFTQGQGVNGLDKKRPWGVVVGTDETMAFKALAFLPVTDYTRLLNSFAPILGEAKDVGDGVREIQAGPQRLFTKEQNGWAFIGQTADALAKLPAEPTRLLGGLERQYDVALRLHVQNIPEVYRTMLVDQLKAGASNVERMENEDEQQYALRKRMLDNQIQSTQMAVREMDRVSMGLNIDQKNGTGYVDLSLIALPGTATAKQFTQNKSSTTDFAGFMQPAALTAGVAARISESDRARATSTLDGIRASAIAQIEKSDELSDDASKQVAKEIIGELITGFKKTIAEGKIDGGARLMLGDKRFTMVAGGYSSDSAAMRATLEKMDALLKSKKADKYPGIKFNAEEHAGVQFHTLSLPISDKEELKQVIGDKLDVVIGTGPKSVYVALGNDAAGSLRQILDKSKSSPAQNALPMELTVSLDPVLRFALGLSQADQSDAAQKRNMRLGLALASLAKSPNKDHVRMAVRPLKNGGRYRVLLEEGVLRVIGQATHAATNAAGLQAAQ